jgi:hypothetical protein
LNQNSWSSFLINDLIQVNVHDSSRGRNLYSICCKRWQDEFVASLWCFAIMYKMEHFSSIKLLG